MIDGKRTPVLCSRHTGRAAVTSTISDPAILPESDVAATGLTCAARCFCLVRRGSPSDSAAAVSMVQVNCHESSVRQRGCRRDDVVVPPRAPLPADTPNLVTPRGLALLRAELAELEALHAEKQRASLSTHESARELAIVDGQLAPLRTRLDSAVRTTTTTMSTGAAGRYHGRWSRSP